MSKRTEAAAIVAQLDAEYRRAAEALRSALKAYMQAGKLPSPTLHGERGVTYPELRLGSPGLLVSARRRRIIEIRDHLRASLNG